VIIFLQVVTDLLLNGYNLSKEYDMNEVIKKAAVFTAVYFLLCTAVLWLTFFIAVTLQVFWKFFAAVFVIAVAVISFNHYNCAKRLKDITRNWKRPNLSVV